MTTIRYIYFILITVFLFAACTQQNKTKEQLLAEGLEQIQKNRPGIAVVLFKKALEKDQNYFEARLQLAKAYNLHGNPAAAEKELVKVQRQNPSSAEARIEMAKTLVLSKRPDNALQVLSGHLALANPDCEALEIAGRAHSQKEEYSSAIALLKKAVDICSQTKTDPALYLAMTYAAGGNAGEAEQRVNEVLAKEPDNRKALYILADLQMRRKDRPAAFRTLDRIIEANPDDIEARYRKGMLLVDNGEYDSALAISQAMTKKFSTQPEGHRLQGFALFLKKQYADALAPLQKSLLQQPNAGTYYILGLTHSYRNETQQAMNQFQKALDLQPSFTKARIQLAQILLNSKMIDEAIKEVKKGLAQDNEDAFGHNVLGSALLAKGNYTEGMAALNRALALDSSLADVHLKKGIAAMKRGLDQQAESELASAIRIKPEAQDARRILALHYFNNNQQEKAVELLKKGLQGGAADAVPYYLIGESYVRQNKLKEGEAYLIKAKEADPKYDPAYHRLASVYLLQQKQNQAIQELNSLLKHSPQNVPGLLLLASLHEMNGEEKEARRNYLLAADTGKHAGVLSAAQYLRRTGDSEKALKVLTETINAAGADSDISLLDLKGRILLADKKQKEALSLFEKIERRNPQLGYLYTVNAYLSSKDYAKALERVRQEIRKNPGAPGIQAELSRVQLLSGKKQDAIETAREIIRKTPSSPVGHMALALIHQMSNENDKAIEILKAASTLKHPDLLVMLSNLYLARKNYPAALEQNRQAESLKPRSEQVLLQKAMILHAMSRKKEAETEYERVLLLSPGQVAALNNLAFLYAEENRSLTQAFLFAMRAFIAAPDNDLVRDTLGYVLVKNGRLEQGLRILNKASESRPDDPAIHYHLGMAYHESGNSSKAIMHLEKALALGEFSDGENAKLLLEKIRKKGTT